MVQGYPPKSQVRGDEPLSSMFVLARFQNYIPVLRLFFGVSTDECYDKRCDRYHNLFIVLTPHQRRTHLAKSVTERQGNLVRYDRNRQNIIVRAGDQWLGRIFWSDANAEWRVDGGRRRDRARRCFGSAATCISRRVEGSGTTIDGRGCYVVEEILECGGSGRNTRRCSIGRRQRNDSRVVADNRPERRDLRYGRYRFAIREVKRSRATAC